MVLSVCLPVCTVCVCVSVCMSVCLYETCIRPALVAARCSADTRRSKSGRCAPGTHSAGRSGRLPTRFSLTDTNPNPKILIVRCVLSSSHGSSSPVPSCSSFFSSRPSTSRYPPLSLSLQSTHTYHMHLKALVFHQNAYMWLVCLSVCLSVCHSVCVSAEYTVWVKEIPPCGFQTFFPKRLGIFTKFFTYLLCVPTYARLQILYSITSNFDEVMPY